MYAPQQQQPMPPVGYASQQPMPPIGYAQQQPMPMGYAQQPPSNLPMGYVPQPQSMMFAGPPQPQQPMGGYYAAQQPMPMSMPVAQPVGVVYTTGASVAPYVAEPELHVGRRRYCWTCLRWLECSGRANRACLLWGAIYGLLGVSCREEERLSYRAAVTPSRLVISETVYECGLCERKQVQLSVPLALVMDVDRTEECCCEHVFVRVFNPQKPMEPKRNCCGCRENAIDLVCLDDAPAMQAALSLARDRAGGFRQDAYVATVGAPKF